MREIKFRAWDSENNEMIYGVGVTPISDLSIPYSIGEPGKDFDQFNYYIESKLMQFTGLLDKNGTEIYEDDLLKSKHEQIGKVYYFCDSYLIHWIKENYESNLRKCTDCEVIGNIYENSELPEASE